MYAFARAAEGVKSRRSAVIVAEGVYREGAISLRPNVDLYGGFRASDWQRDIFAHATVLDGARSGRVLGCWSGARTDGFRIRNGRTRALGGAILCLTASPVITNNVFENNRTLAPQPWKPRVMHEDDNDGGAIACTGDCRAVIRHNLFYRNSTETGRGGAIAVNRSSPRIEANVFLDNTAGLADPMRSSDGGALSIYDHARPEVSGNLFIRNRTLGTNDGGGIFVALWSSPVLAGNVIVGSHGDDDGGALFVGGQKHHYGTPLDPIPPATEFLVRITGNVIAGNGNASASSGAMRVTMNSRVLLEGNVILRNPGGVNLQRSDAEVVRNTILDPVIFRERGTGRFADSILTGGLRLETPAPVTGCTLRDPLPGSGNTTDRPAFADDGAAFVAASSRFEPARMQTDFTLDAAALPPGDIVNRPIRLGDYWTIVAAAGAGKLSVWGDTGDRRTLELLPAYRQEK